MRDLQSILQTAGVVDKMLNAYDGFAATAMQVLLKHQMSMFEGRMTYEAIAEYAWKLADAMMEERRKRGLGAPAK